MPGMLLARGERKVIPFRVKLADHLPPSWHSKVSKVAYTVEIRVDIPWWPDRTARFALPLLAAARKVVHRGGLYSNAPEGPRGTELNLELALESVAVELGGVVRGAVAVINAEHHRVRRLEVAMVIRDAPSSKSQIGPEEVHRTAPVVLTADAPEGGRSYPFELRLPNDLPPSFTSALVALEWEARGARSGALRARPRHRHQPRGLRHRR